MAREKRLASDELFTFEDAKTLLTKIVKGKDTLTPAQRHQILTQSPYLGEPDNSCLTRALNRFERQASAESLHGGNKRDDWL